MAIQLSEYRYFFNDVQFGIDVKEARRQLTVNQQQLADLVDLEAGTTISAIERGRADNSISLRAFLKICEALDLTPGYYFDLDALATVHEYNSR